MIRRLLLALALLTVPLCASPAYAQLDNANVQSNCNTVSYPSGTTRAIVQTTAGLLCTSASASGTFTNNAAGSTGSAVPGSASYDGVNVAGNLRGQTGVNPSGSVYAAQTDLTSVAGTTVKTGAGTASGAIRVELPTDGTGLVSAAQSGTWTVQPGNTANTTPWLTTTASSAAAAAITPVVSAAAETGHVLKAGAGNLYSLTVTTGGTAGYVMLHNATSVPAAGSVTPLACVQVAANATVTLGGGGDPPTRFSTGISASFSSTGCFTQTDSATAFFSGKVQ